MELFILPLIILPLIIGLVIVVLVFLAIPIGIYNGLVSARNTCDESWSDIDTELRRRYDLIPNIINSVKGYAQHESGVFVRVTAARNAAQANHGSPEAQAKDENMLVAGLRQVFALAENYPDLKASANFIQLQQELANTEDRIQRSRRFYNANVRDFNTRTQTFPSSIIAGMGGFTKKEFFEIEDAAMREAPQVQF